MLSGEGSDRNGIGQRRKVREVWFPPEPGFSQLLQGNSRAQIVLRGSSHLRVREWAFCIQMSINYCLRSVDRWGGGGSCVTSPGEVLSFGPGHFCSEEGSRILSAVLTFTG